VGLVVHGSVQRAGDTVRINASLVDVPGKSTLWSERYDRSGANVLALQDEVAWQIAAHLAKVTGGAAPERPSAAQQTTAAAYDAYLRGLAHIKGRSSLSRVDERLAGGIAEFERSVAADPDFALGHAMLASAYTQRFFYEATDPSFEQKAFLEIEKALALNPDLAEAYVARAQIVWNVRNGFQHERAVRDLQRALANNPSLAEAHIELGKVYFHIGLLDKAIAANDEAIRLDPLATVAGRRRFGALFDAGRFEAVRDVLSRNPRWLQPSMKAEAQLAMGEAEAALATLTSGASDQRDTGFRDFEPNALAVLAHAHAKVGRRADAERALQIALPRVVNPTGLSDIHHAQFAIGCAYALLGNKDEAVRWLTRAADEGLPSYPKFSSHVDVASLKGYPAFDALVERLRRDWERWRATL
jgi:tetratricopeptide (TPR) repeat protein